MLLAGFDLDPTVAAGVLIALLILSYWLFSSGGGSEQKAMTTVAAKPEKAPAAPPVDLWTADLAEHDGTVEGKRLWLAADGFVFDVEDGRGFYGPGGPYAGFSGRDATIGLATMEVDVTKWGPRTKSSELSAAEADTLASWVARFRAKYQVVGFLNDGANPTTVAMAAAKGLLKA